MLLVFPALGLNRKKKKLHIESRVANVTRSYSRFLSQNIELLEVNKIQTFNLCQVCDVLKTATGFNKNRSVNINLV